MVSLVMFLIAILLPYSVGGAVTVSYTVSSSWNGGQQLALTFTNTGSAAICSVIFSITFPSGTTISNSWNMEPVSGSSTKFSLPSWLNIAAGNTYTSTGLNTNGNGKPTISITSYSECGGGSGTTTTTTTPKPGTTTTTTTKPGQTTTTTTTKSGQTTTTTTTKSGQTTTTTTVPSGGQTLVVSPTITTKQTCMDESKASGPITAQLNKPITGGEFTFYGIGGNGACGYDDSTPSMSAAASGDLFNSNAQWVPSCMSDKRYLLNDAICINKCVKIQYKGKTLTVPINNKCPECAPNHVDLSEAAFNWLEPGGGTVGIAKDATITYIECA